MTMVIDHVDGHYQMQSMFYGRVYVWCPECVVVECDCGETVILTASESACRCGVDHELWSEKPWLSKTSGTKHHTPGSKSIGSGKTNT